MKRTQIYLDAEQDRRLAKHATAAGTTKSTLIREAIDAYLVASVSDAARLAQFRAALDEVASKPASLPNGRSYVERMRAGDEQRQRSIERRRR